jgi:hypothetical protein
MLNYIVCYPAGAAGRFLSTIIYKTANQIDDFVLTTPENSGHLESQNGIISGYDYVDNNNHPFVFKDLIPNNLNDTIPVFSTHAFPKFKVIDSIGHFNTTRFITIVHENTDYNELVANVLMKAIVPQIKIILNSPSGVDQFKNKTYFYSAVYIVTRFKDTYGYELTLDNLIDINTIKYLFELDMQRRKFNEEELSKFKSSFTIPDNFKDKMLVVKYKDIFTKTATSYIALEQLSNFMGVDIPNSVYESYDNYVINQPMMLNKYFPWLTKTVDTR